MSSSSALPTFDHLELTEIPEPVMLRHGVLTPAKAGAEIAPFRSAYNRGRWHRHFDDIIFNNAPAFNYSYKPLLIYFYEAGWGELSSGHLQQLSALNHPQYQQHINVLVVTAQSLPQLRQQGLSLEVFEDRHNELATLLGVYADHAPAWNTYAGIENNIALPALYLLGEMREVVIAHANKELDAQLPVNDALVALTTDRWRHVKRSA